ncbi:ATP-binding protein [Streptomyces griseoincarnatus]|uniref:ATP-binding protein n=1 Tax=Streptomyces griseoincarnatus TaxID=29305 RepID=A0ABT0VQS0_STRGI|nr:MULTISPECIES: ATP-binding protein [Streptomyces]MBJ6613545.1 ATP-binding protein [Streptomyces sp. I3(2020)]MBJ6629873.1 ATP-binding protein [Streptomyces sp. I4(2020)]MCM2513689.1 ATP-binding protein [Streptomyces griseoincarnatus]
MESLSVDEGETVPGAPRLRASYALDAEGAWIAQARHLAAEFLERARTENGLPVPDRVVEITQLVVSELVTNARKYAPGPVGLDLRVFGDAVEVVVHDGNPEAPRPRDADPGRVGQHGLEIVMAVADALDVRREAEGKSITARIALSA